MLAIAAVVSAGLAACSLGADFDAFTTELGPDSGADVPDIDGSSPTESGTSETGASDAGAGDGDASAALDAAQCGDAWVGSSMIASNGFCIDSTEVSQKDYAQFVASMSGNFAGQPDECAWNTSWQPSVQCPHDAGSTLPASGVHWCAAHAYCKWAGKRLCGKIGGGKEDGTNDGGTSSNMWFAACSSFGTTTFPYGNLYDGNKCNGGDRDSGGRLPVGTSGCEGSLSGLFDMSGNVEEWTDLCIVEPDGGPKEDRCARRGGDTGEDPASLRCDGNNYGTRDTRQCFVGFRCCADLVP